MSVAAPSAGLAVMPDSPSEPPHCRPTTSSLSGIGTRSTALTAGSSSAIAAIAAAIVLRVPPVSWMVRPWKRSSPEAPNACRMRPTCITSQPSPMNSAAPTLGCVAWPHSTRCSVS